jgi:transposase
LQQAATFVTSLAVSVTSFAPGLASVRKPNLVRFVARAGVRHRRAAEGITFAISSEALFRELHSAGAYFGIAPRGGRFVFVIASKPLFPALRSVGAYFGIAPRRWVYFRNRFVIVSLFGLTKRCSRRLRRG